MAGHKRSPTQIEHDRAEIASRYLHGHKQSQIAAALGISQQQVSTDLRFIQAEWHQSAIRDFDAHKAQELAKLDELERECWDAWQRSCQPLEHVHTEQSEDEVQLRAGHAGRLRVPGMRKRKKVSKRTEMQVGNSAFLYAVERCIEQRAKILGLHAAVDVNLTGQISFGDLWSLAQQDEPQIRVLPPVEVDSGEAG